MRAILPHLLSLLLALAASYAGAGQNCALQAPAPEALRKGMALALETRDRLERSGAEVVLIGRVGSDLSEHGLRYSHAGYAWRDNPKGRWLVTHLLNRCGRADSALFDEGLGNFFLDDPFAYEAIVVVPGRDLQGKLVAVLISGLPVALHTVDYSVIAHPYSTRYQNSNQWLLEVATAALAKTAVINGRANAQRWLRENGYTPAQVRISPMKRLGARLFSANVRFDDHDASARASGRYPVVSVESVLGFVVALDRDAHQFVIVLD